MDLKKCYEELGGNYEDVYLRLMSDEPIERFLRKFVEMDDCGAMQKALEAKDYHGAFLKAHDLKGTSSGLGLTRLYNSSSLLCEELRSGTPSDDYQKLVDEVVKDCGDIRAAVKKYSE